MKELIKLLDEGKFDKKKRLNTLVKLLYSKNGRLVTSNLHHINSAYDLRDYIEVSIIRVDYSSDYIISLK